MTFERLSNDFANCQEFEVTSFSELHGEEPSQMARLIVQEANKLYIYNHADRNRVLKFLSACLQSRRDEFVALLEAYSAPARTSP